MKDLETPEVPNGKPPNKISIPRWLALLLTPFVWLVAIPFAHGVIPWVISWLTPHYGWTSGRLGNWNLFGLIPVVGGAVGLLWVMILGFAHASEVPERVELNWQPKLLLLRGPYRFTRNPMYVAELMLWLGWAIFFGSITILISFLVICVVVNFIVQREERDLETQFGDAYRQYCATVPRWLGKPRH